ncbi:MAG: molybdenum cofactor guanylyltransferase MobA [Halioglobus sp.]
MDNKLTTTGLILAGGTGRRVNGADKGTLLWQGKPLAAHVASMLAPQVDELLLSCNRNFDTYRQICTTLITDIREDYQGPLAGLEATVAHLQSDYLVIVPCDNPELPGDLVERLLYPHLNNHDGVLDISFVDDGERKQYLFAAIRCGCLSSLGPYLDSGQRAVRHWFNSLNTVAVDFSDQAELFKNLNHLQQFIE